MAGNPYEPLAIQIAKQYGLPPQVFVRQIDAESGWDPNAKSPAGAQGLGQLMPATARGLGVTDPYDPKQSLEGAAKYLREQLDHFGNIKLALAAYNAGPGAVETAGGVPPFEETHDYVNKILAGSDAGAEGTPRAGEAQVPSQPAAPARSLGPDLAGAVLSSLGASPAEELANIVGAVASTTPTSAAVTPSSDVPAALTLPAPKGVGIAYPLPKPAKIIGVPYEGTHRDFGNWESDNAVDLATGAGTPVRAPFSGTIGSQFGALDSSNPQLAGLRVHVNGKKNEAYLAHLSKLIVEPGQRVRKGQIIGYSGEANGVAHLHFALRKGSPLKLLGGSR